MDINITLLIYALSFGAICYWLNWKLKALERVQQSFERFMNILDIKKVESYVQLSQKEADLRVEEEKRRIESEYIQQLKKSSDVTQQFVDEIGPMINSTMTLIRYIPRNERGFAVNNALSQSGKGLIMKRLLQNILNDDKYMEIPSPSEMSAIALSEALKKGRKGFEEEGE